MMPQARIATAALLLALAGCSPAWTGQESFPESVESLAVLPVEVVPFEHAAGSTTASLLSSALLKNTSFRVVPTSSVERLRLDPGYERAFGRFRTLALGAGQVEAEVSRSLGERTGVRGLVWTTLSTGLASQVRGELSMTIRIVDAHSGRILWRSFRRHPFEGDSSETAFSRVIARLIEDMIQGLPRPAGEIEP